MHKPEYRINDQASMTNDQKFLLLNHLVIDWSLGFGRWAFLQDSGLGFGISLEISTIR
jgi:hypothetical protein